MYCQEKDISNLNSLLKITALMLSIMFASWYYSFCLNVKRRKKIFIFRNGNSEKILELQEQISINDIYPYSFSYNEDNKYNDTMIIDLLFSRCHRNILISGYFEKITEYEWIIRISKLLGYKVYILSIDNGNNLEDDYRTNYFTSKTLYEVNDGDFLDSEDDGTEEKSSSSVSEKEDSEGDSEGKSSEDSESSKGDESVSEGEEGKSSEDSESSKGDEGVSEGDEGSSEGDEGSSEGEEGDEGSSEGDEGSSEGKSSEDEYDDGEKIVENNTIFSKFSSWIYV